MIVTDCENNVLEQKHQVKVFLMTTMTMILICYHVWDEFGIGRPKCFHDFFYHSVQDNLDKFLISP